MPIYARKVIVLAPDRARIALEVPPAIARRLVTTNKAFHENKNAKVIERLVLKRIPGKPVKAPTRPSVRSYCGKALSRTVSVSRSAPCRWCGDGFDADGSVCSICHGTRSQLLVTGHVAELDTSIVHHPEDAQIYRAAVLEACGIQVL